MRVILWLRVERIQRVMGGGVGGVGGFLFLPGSCPLQDRSIR